MKKIINLIGLLAALSTNLSAQYNIDWMSDAGNYSKTAVMSAKDNLDNLIVTGYWQSYHIFTRKVSISGTLLWETEDSSGLPGLYEKPYWTNCDANNNIFVVGKRYSIGSGWEYPDAIIALKYSPEGVLLWKQIIPISMLIGSQHPAFNLRSEVDNNGNLYIGSFGATPTGVILSKIDVNGNILFTNTSIVNSPLGFGSMRLKGNKVVLATGSGLTNVAPIYVWNTSGALLWTAAAVGRGANDVEIDDNGDVYVISHLINAVSPTSGEDFTMTKFNSSGTQLWKKDYHFGGSEVPTRFLYSNNRLSAIGWGTSSPASAYFDWKTFQVDTDGILLWSAFYNGTVSNDELPYFITAKPNGEVIVTGKGGPSPDPNNSSYLQMVIVQYSNTGNQVWVDTPNQYGGWGLSCMLASDNSMFAISSANMTAYHYNPAPATTKWIVNVQNFSFSPNSLPSVQLGDTIRWVWINGSHTTTNLIIPPLAATWDHVINVSNQSFEYVPTVAGVYNYKCTPHFPNMVGSFTVSEPAGFALNLKVFLEGPFSGGQMNANLNTEGLLPLVQPYNISPWNYTGSESVNSIPNVNIVDWVLVELRDAANAASATSGTRISMRAAFLLKNGSVVDIDGYSPLQFTNSVAQQLFVIVWHRNHLGIISANGLTQSGGIYSYDFSTSLNQVYGSGAGYKNVASGVFGMVSADSNHDGFINIADKIQWSTATGSRGYLNADFSADSQVNNSDKNDKWYPNQIYSIQVPQ